MLIRTTDKIDLFVANEISHPSKNSSFEVLSLIIIIITALNPYGPLRGAVTTVDLRSPQRRLRTSDPPGHASVRRCNLRGWPGDLQLAIGFLPS